MRLCKPSHKDNNPQNAQYQNPQFLEKPENCKGRGDPNQKQGAKGDLPKNNHYPTDDDSHKPKRESHNSPKNCVVAVERSKKESQHEGKGKAVVEKNQEAIEDPQKRGDTLHIPKIGGIEETLYQKSGSFTKTSGQARKHPPHDNKIPPTVAKERSP
jgi:hypothetical protein